MESYDKILDKHEVALGWYYKNPLFRFNKLEQNYFIEVSLQVRRLFVSCTSETITCFEFI